MSAGWQSTGNDTLRDLKAGEYSITVTDANDCQIYTEFRINENSIFIPNAFSPNNDSRNDFFEVYGVGETKYFNVLVFDRIGELVFESDSPQFKWDGTYRGTIEPMNVYVYIIKVVFNNGDSRFYKGSVTLLR